MRSLLLVPGDSPGKLETAFSAGADAVVIDLEESVALADKSLARRLARDAIAARPEGGPLVYVKVNGLDTGLVGEDLAATVSARPDGIVLPKSRNGADIQHLSTKLRVEEIRAGLPDGGILIVPIVTQSGLAVLSAATYAGCSPRLAGIAWDTDALSAGVGARSVFDDHGGYTDVFRHARAITLLAAASAGVPAIDTARRDLGDTARLRAECGQAARDGFRAKLAIHPDQVPVLNEMFAPSRKAVADAGTVAAAVGSPR